MRYSLPILFLASVAFLSGCDKPAESTKASEGTTTSKSGTTEKSKGTIGVSLLTLDNPFFKVIGDNITSEGKRHGYETIVVSGDKDVAKQGNQIKDFIVK